MSARITGIVLAALALVCGADADACSYRLGWEMRFPAANSQDVPIDAEFVLSGAGTASGTATLRADGTSTDLAVTLRGLVNGDEPWTYIVRPDAPLAPNTAYTLTLTASAGQTPVVQRFRTGASATSGPLAPMTVDAITAMDTDNGCGNNHLACIGTSGPGMVEVTVRRQRDNTITAQQIQTTTGDLLFFHETPFSREASCFEVRTRDLAGHLGPASRVCPNASQVPTRPLFTQLYSVCQIRCEGGQIRLVAQSPENTSRCAEATPDEGGGCSSRGGRSDVSGGVLVAAGALAMVLCRRRSPG